MFYFCVYTNKNKFKFTTKFKLFFHKKLTIRFLHNEIQFNRTHTFTFFCILNLNKKYHHHIFLTNKVRDCEFIKTNR